LSEALAIVWLCWLYDAINNLPHLRRGLALAHATALLTLERTLHLNPELFLNTWLVAHRAIALAASDYYDLAHFGVTLALVGWLWWRHPSIYRPLRNTLVFINVIGLAVFWCYPLAPPRMLSGAGFVDMVAVSHAFGSWHSGALASQANQYAAMPSLHVAWAAWCALAIWRISKHRVWSIAGLAYVALTSLVVLATANHFLLDVVAGLLTTAAAAGGTGLWNRRRLGHLPRAVDLETPPGQTGSALEAWHHRTHLGAGTRLPG